MQEIITKLQEEKRRIEENPELPITKNTKKLRQKLFKAKHVKKKHINLELSLAPPVSIDVEPLQVIYPTDHANYEDI